MLKKYLKSILIPMLAILVISAGAWARPKVEELILQGNKLCNEGKYKDAADIYKQALSEYNSADAAYNLGITYEINLRDMQQALDYYKRFLNLEQNSDDTTLVKAWVEEIEATYFPKAPPTPKKLDDLSPRLKELVIDSLKQAREFYRQSKYEDAANKYQEVLELYESSDAAYNLGQIYDKKLNQKQKAIKYYQQFLYLEPSSPDRDMVRQWIGKARGSLEDKSSPPNP